MRILLIEDHTIVRLGMVVTLEKLLTPVQIDESDNFNDALQYLSQHPYDLVILDINIPAGTNLQMISVIHLKQPTVKILVYSASDEKLHSLRYLQAGASGYLMKDSPATEIKEAITSVLNGRKYVSPQIRQNLLDDYADNGGRSNNNPLLNLSGREIEIMEMLAAGKSVGEIGRICNLQVSTISTYKARIFKKLNVNNIIELSEKRKQYNF